MSRPVRVYRLDVTWPDGQAARHARRRFITRKGADHHALVLREAGATVTIHPSHPVTWDPPAPEAPMDYQQMADAQRTGYAVARAMATNDTDRVARIVADLTPEQMRRVVFGTAAMAAHVVERSGLDWDALRDEMERRLTA